MSFGAGPDDEPRNENGATVLADFDKDELF